MLEQNRRRQDLSPGTGETSVTDSDRGEFVRLLVTHESYVRAYILSLLPRWAEAEEVFQETCVRLYQQIDEWDPSKSFRAWACTLAYYEVLTHRKKTQRDQSRFGQAFLDAVVRQFTDESFADDLRADALRNCLGKLRADHRRILDLTYRDELSVEQVARQSNRTIDAVYKTLMRVRKLLRNCIEREIHNWERE
jgi:RNA polymerase sigma-70 factor (ECF subfamily)